MRAIELCAGAGGQALGLEMAGFEHAGLFENDAHACQTLRLNRPDWPVFEHDLFEPFDFSRYEDVDLLAGGLPCPPFSKAGKQLGERDERNLFTRGIEIAKVVRPRAIMFENVRGMLDSSFSAYRAWINEELSSAGYWVDWRLLNASDFGVPQLRPRVVMIAVKREDAKRFSWPDAFDRCEPPTVGECLYDLMASGGWGEANAWAKKANRIAPTLVGGSKKHGGPDLGPTRARNAWAGLGVEGRTIANEVPGPDHRGMPRLTVRMAARIQGFPDDWQFFGRKTAAYRQVGNAFPPPVAEAIARRVVVALQTDVNFLEAAE